VLAGDQTNLARTRARETRHEWRILPMVGSERRIRGYLDGLASAHFQRT